MHDERLRAAWGMAASLTARLLGALGQATDPEDLMPEELRPRSPSIKASEWKP